MRRTTANPFRWALAITVRVPILGPLWLLMKIGEGSEWLFDIISSHLPGVDA